MIIEFTKQGLINRLLDPYGDSGLSIKSVQFDGLPYKTQLERIEYLLYSEELPSGHVVFIARMDDGLIAIGSVFIGIPVILTEGELMTERLSDGEIKALVAAMDEILEAGIR